MVNCSNAKSDLIGMIEGCIANLIINTRSLVLAEQQLNDPGI